MKCQFVGCDIEVKKETQKYCSKSCSNLSRSGATDKRGKVTKVNCSVCDTEFEFTRSTSNRNFKTCSRKCRNIAIGKKHKGKTLSEASKTKISLAKKGKKLSHEHRTLIGKGVSRERNSKWKDGRSFLKVGAADYNFEFTCTLKETVRRRDNNMCQKCGTGKDMSTLMIHHIDMNKKNNDMMNLVTVCHSCHSKIHCGSIENSFNLNDNMINK